MEEECHFGETEGQVNDQIFIDFQRLISFGLWGRIREENRVMGEMKRVTSKATRKRPSENDCTFSPSILFLLNPFLPVTMRTVVDTGLPLTSRRV